MRFKWFPPFVAFGLLLAAASGPAFAGLDSHVESFAVPAQNLSTTLEADDFAIQLAGALEKEAKELKIETAQLDPLVIVRVGNKIPKHLRWIMLHLEAARIPVEFQQITQAEMEATLLEAKQKEQQQLLQTQAGLRSHELMLIQQKKGIEKNNLLISEKAILIVEKINRIICPKTKKQN